MSQYPTNLTDKQWQVTEIILDPQHRMTANGTLYIHWKLEMEDSSSRYRLLTKIQLGCPGRGWDTGALRNFLAEGTVNDAAVTTRIPDYISVYGLDLRTYQVHARCILLDTKTGYRSQYLAVSGIIDL